MKWAGDRDGHGGVPGVPVLQAWDSGTSVVGRIMDPRDVYVH